ncbi:MAG: type II toxin-antitoxin system RelB/DinJ family antitoxin [Myxococcales bacterium]
MHYNIIHRKVCRMAANQLVQSRIDGAIKEEASLVLESMGLTVSDAVRMLLTRIARDHAFPFDPFVPNETTIEAMREARSMGLARANSIAELRAALDADD